MSHGAWCLALYGLRDERFQDYTPQSFFDASKFYITQIQESMEEYLGPSQDFTEQGRKWALTRVFRLFALGGGGGGGVRQGNPGRGGSLFLRGCKPLPHIRADTCS